MTQTLEQEGTQIRDKWVEEVSEKIKNLPTQLRDELSVALSVVRFEIVDKALIVKPKNDLRQARDKMSADVYDSFSNINLLPIAPLIVTKVGDKYQVVDGYTRFIWHSTHTDIKRFGCLVLPELSDEAAMSINLIINSKRSNLSEAEQMSIFYSLHKSGWTNKQIAKWSGFSETSVERQILMEENLAPTVKKQIYTGDFSSRKAEESIAKVMVNKVIPETKRNAIQEQTVKILKTTNVSRDNMAYSKLADKLDRNATLMHKDYTAEQIARSSALHLDQGTFYCPHPDKVDAVEAFMKDMNAEWYKGICCEGPYKYDKDGKRITHMILRAANFVGRENTLGVSYFEGAKEDDMVKEKIPYVKDNIFVWLNSAQPESGRGLVFIDSSGGMAYYSKGLLEYLSKLYPDAVICFLAQDQFVNRRGSLYSLEENCITYWGLKPASNMADFMSKAEAVIEGTLSLVWETSDKSGQPVSVWAYKRS